MIFMALKFLESVATFINSHNINVKLYVISYIVSRRVWNIQYTYIHAILLIKTFITKPTSHYTNEGSYFV